MCVVVGGGISQNGVNPYKKTGYEKWRMPTARMGCAFWGRVTLPLDVVKKKNLRISLEGRLDYNKDLVCVGDHGLKQTMPTKKQNTKR